MEGSFNMRKTPFTVRLNPDTIKKLELLGNPSKVIRKMIHDSLRHEPEVITRTIVKETPALMMFGDNWNKMMDRQYIADMIAEKRPEWVILSTKQDFEVRWSEKF